MICSIIFNAIVIVGLIILSRVYKWKGFKVRQRDVISWAIYGYIIPIWIQFDYVFTNISFLATVISAILFGIAFVIIFAICKKRKFPMLPIVVLVTVVVYLTLSYVYTPPTPSNWSKWFTFGQFKPLDVFSNALYLAPPWIIGLSIARVKPKLGIILPILVFPYSLYSPKIIDEIAHIIGCYKGIDQLGVCMVTASCMYLIAIYAVTALVVAVLVIKVRGIQR